jgi:hypothetical protein
MFASAERGLDRLGHERNGQYEEHGVHIRIGEHAFHLTVAPQLGVVWCQRLYASLCLGHALARAATDGDKRGSVRQRQQVRHVAANGEP